MRSNRIDEALYGAKYSHLHDSFKTTISSADTDSCISCQEKGGIIMFEAASSDFAKSIGGQAQTSIRSNSMIIKSIDSRAFVLATPELSKQSFNFVGFDSAGNMSKHQVLVNVKLGSNGLVLDFRLSGGYSSRFRYNLESGMVEMGGGFTPTAPQARLSWDDRWNNCMLKQVPDGPFTSVYWVLSGGSLLSTGDCIGSTNGWW